MNEIVWAKIALSTFLTWIFLYFWLSPIAMEMLALLMIIDLVTGVIKVKMIAGWDAITSFRLLKGIGMKMLNLLLIFGISASLKALWMPPSILIDTCIAIIVTGEIYSIIQNVYSAQTGKKLTEYKALITLLERLAEFFTSKVNKKD